METKNNVSTNDWAHFRFCIIAPVIQGLYPDASEAAYYRRVAESEITRPDGRPFKYSPDTLERWTGLYRKFGMDGLASGSRSDKGSSRVLDDDASARILSLLGEFPRISATKIHEFLLKEGLIKATVSVRAVQRFVKENNLRSSRPMSIRDRRAFEMPEFGCLWQADTAYLPYITENGRKHRTYLIMIIDDHSRLIVGGEIFYSDNAYNYQKVLKDSIVTYGIPDSLYMDNGGPYRNDQLTAILDSLGIVESHTPVRDGASKGKVERNFRTLRSRWLSTLNADEIESLAEFNDRLTLYIRQHNTTIHSATGEAPIERYMRTRSHVRSPKSREWLDECFMNRLLRKVNNDSCITIDGELYDAPMQFIGMKVEVRFLPGRMEGAYILYGEHRFPIFRTDKNANAFAKRNSNLPDIRFSEGGAIDELQ